MTLPAAWCSRPAPPSCWRGASACPGPRLPRAPAALDEALAADRRRRGAGECGQMERWCATARSSTCGAMRATSSRARSRFGEPRSSASSHVAARAAAAGLGARAGLVLGLAALLGGVAAPAGGGANLAPVLSRNGARAAARAVARAIFIHVAQSFLDRSWLWHGDPEVVRRRWCSTAVRELAGNEPDHRVRAALRGLDAGVTALTQQVPRRFIGIYTKQSNPVVDAWVLQGRHRFGSGRGP